MTLSISFLDGWMAAQAPALPAEWLMRIYLTLGWAVVLAALGSVLGAGLPRRPRLLLVAGLLGWSCLPGPLSPAYWLGLAFQSPSGMSLLLCGWLLWHRLGSSSAQPGFALPWLPALLLVAVGYLLLLDTLALLPWQIYAMGFNTATVVVLMALAVLPWLLVLNHAKGKQSDRGSAGDNRSLGHALAGAVWLAPLVLLWFALTRLPSGNVWDALLDPLLWLLLQGVLLRSAYRRLRASR